MDSLIDRDDLLSPEEAARRLPTRPHRSTVLRWCLRGMQTPDGQRVRLRFRRLGRRILIDPADLVAFAEALADAEVREAESAGLATPRVSYSGHKPRRSGRAAQVEREAEQLGI